MKSTALLAIILAIVSTGLAGDSAPSMPMQVKFENSAESGWLQKKVLDSRLLDDMANPSTWVLTGQGSMTFAPAESNLGKPRVRVDVNVHDQRPSGPGVSGLPTVNLRRDFGGDNWTAFNRVSFWIRPAMSGLNVFSMAVTLRNDGAQKVPDVYQREGIHHITVANNQWTHVVWEITPLARDKVTSLTFNYWINKRLPDQSDRVAFEIAGLELQRVDPDHYEGWNVAPGRFSFSHTGYPTGASKSAIASGLGAKEFSVLRADNGEPVLTKPVKKSKNRLGEFEVLDFSEITRTGSYIVRAGDLSSREFRIDPDVWSGTIWKTINFFFGERCGMEIPGIHDACHRDWQAVLGDRKIVMNGGWHDAGDLSQGLINTAEATYAMFALAQRMKMRGDDPVLANRVMDEAKWGLDWLLKVRFEGGHRIGFASNNLWTNGIIGDADDRTRVAQNNPNVNFLAATAEARAYKALKESDPQLAERTLRIAEEDWRYAVAGKESAENLSTPAFASSEMELASVGILASVELYEATGKQEYAAKAREFAKVVIASQQRTYVGKEFPLAGFFYTGPDRKTIFHQFHRGNDQAPVVAMARMCEAFPNDAEWITWYSVAALHSEYQKAVAGTTEPYRVLPAYLYKDDEYLQVPPDGDRYQASREAYKEQVLRGMPIGDGFYLKAFPVWFARRGNYGVLLSQAKALSAAAHLRQNLEAADLAQQQLQWVLGRNPFSQSTMWGEGYDFAQQYTVSSGDFVGSLPVGMMTRGNADAPYWPAQNGFVYKEVWVHPSARWLWLMQDLAGQALIEGRVASGNGSPITFKNSRTGHVMAVTPEAVTGAFRAFIPEGKYDVTADGQQRAITLLPGGTYQLDLRARQRLDFEATAETQRDGAVIIRVSASGRGPHNFKILADSLLIEKATTKEITLEPGKTARLEWKARPTAANTPWVAVVVADEDVLQRKELVSTPDAQQKP
ncbi:MAG TPA: glycoside hydrolase family 9 protein [Terriglobales bacterium]|nr:glycoside hydrolase family 9 protein [Terriglobales bacterium]